MRTSYIGKMNNYNTLNLILGEGMKEWRKVPWKTESELNTFINDKFFKSNITLQYYKTNDDIYGEYVTDSTANAINEISKLKDKGSVVVITDDTSKYNGISGVDVKNVSSVQGSEYDYAIVDINWDNIARVGTQISMIKWLKMFYMTTQRSKKGTIIVDSNNFFERNRITFESDVNAANEFSLSQTAIDSYKEWKLGMMPKSVGNVKWNFKEPEQNKYTADIINAFFDAHPEIVGDLSQEEKNEWIDKILKGDTSGDRDFNAFDDLYKQYGPPVKTDDDNDDDTDGSDGNTVLLTHDPLKVYHPEDRSLIEKLDNIRTNKNAFEDLPLNEMKDILDFLHDPNEVDVVKKLHNEKIKKANEQLNSDKNDQNAKDTIDDLRQLNIMLDEYSKQSNLNDWINKYNNKAKGEGKEEYGKKPVIDKTPVSIFDKPSSRTDNCGMKGKVE